MTARVLKSLLDISRWTSIRLTFAGGMLKRIVSVVGPCEVFYIAGLTAVTIGVVQISEAAGWIICGSILLVTSIYPYTREK